MSQARTSPPAGSLERLEADVRTRVAGFRAAVGAFWDWTSLVYPPWGRPAASQLGRGGAVGGVPRARPVAAPGGAGSTASRASATSPRRTREPTHSGAAGQRRCLRSGQPGACPSGRPAPPVHAVGAARATFRGGCPAALLSGAPLGAHRAAAPRGARPGRCFTLLDCLCAGKRRCSTRREPCCAARCASAPACAATEDRQRAPTALLQVLPPFRLLPPPSTSSLLSQLPPSPRPGPLSAAHLCHLFPLLPCPLPPW